MLENQARAHSTGLLESTTGGTEAEQATTGGRQKLNCLDAGYFDREQDHWTAIYNSHLRCSEEKSCRCH